MNIIMIVAYALNRAIGLDNKLLWRLPKDLQFFKNTTFGFVVIMGRKTYESLGKYKPLPDRVNIIITRNKEYVPENANEQTYVCHSLKEAIELAIRLGFKQIFIGGGGEIYKEALEQQDYPVTEILATEVQAERLGDTFFPDIRAVWGMVETELIESHKKDEKHFADFNIMRYRRWVA